MPGCDAPFAGGRVDAATDDGDGAGSADEEHDGAGNELAGPAPTCIGWRSNSASAAIATADSGLKNR